MSTASSGYLITLNDTKKKKKKILIIISPGSPPSSYTGRHEVENMSLESGFTA